jgi:hypothetical protein
MMATLAKFSIRTGGPGMADEQRDRLEYFRSFINAVEEGAAIPPVAEDDLRRLHEVSADIAKRRVGKDGMVSVDLMARVFQCAFPSCERQHHIHALHHAGKCLTFV